MIPLVVVTFVDLFVTVFNILLIVRVVSSYIMKPGNRFYGGVVSLTEPVLGPVRRLIPLGGGIDWAPFATFFLLQGLQYLIHYLIGM